MKRHVSILFSLTLLIAIVISGIHIVSFNPSFFEKRFGENQIPQKLNVSYEDTVEANQILLDYVLGNKENLDFEVNIENTSVSFFNQKEKDHMVDVKNLYQSSVTIRNISFVVSLISLLMLLFGFKEKDLHAYRVGFYKALGIIGTFLFALGFYAFIDFNGFWTSFHELVFTNDLWLLNPQTDRMIVMYDLDLFLNMVRNILIFNVLSLMVLTHILHLDKIVKGFKK